VRFVRFVVFIILMGINESLMVINVEKLGVWRWVWELGGETSKL
jgi:hypothetical protein